MKMMNGIQNGTQVLQQVILKWLIFAYYGCCNTYITIDTHYTKELSIIASSNPPHFTLRWLQDAMPSTPTLFISDITLKTTGGPGNKCKLDKVIDFASDG